MIPREEIQHGTWYVGYLVEDGEQRGERTMLASKMATTSGLAFFDRETQKYHRFREGFITGGDGFEPVEAWRDAV